MRYLVPCLPVKKKKKIRLKKYIFYEVWKIIKTLSSCISTLNNI